MKKLLLVVIVLSCFSCRKRQKEAFPGLEGTWISIGSVHSSGSIASPDAFYPVQVHVIDDKRVVVFGDTLPYTSDESSGDNAVFSVVSDYYPSMNYTRLVYGKKSRYVAYSSSSGSSSGHGSIHLSSAGYHPNPSLKEFIGKLSGARMLAGSFHEVSYYPVRDTTYDTSLYVEFTVVNDSTIAFDRSIAVPGGGILHYKSTGDPAGTVTFEVFHLYSNTITTLVYTIATDAITFREWERDFPQVVTVELR